MTMKGGCEHWLPCLQFHHASKTPLTNQQCCKLHLSITSLCMLCVMWPQRFMTSLPPFSSMHASSLVPARIRTASAHILFPFRTLFRFRARGVLIDFSEDWWRRGVCPLSHSVTPNQPCLIGKPKKGALCFGFALPLYFKHVPLRPLPSMCDVHNLVTLQPNWQTGISYVGSPREVLIVAGMFRCH
jgi:hypothetical protein